MSRVFFIRVQFVFLVSSFVSFGAAGQQVTVDKFYANFHCEAYLEIYNGLYDWIEGTSYSGGQKLSSGEKISIGAVTVANLNDTDGDNNLDNQDTDVRYSTAVGRNEVDLIKVVVKKLDPNASLTGNVTLTIVSGAAKFWISPWKGTQIPSPYVFPATELEKTIYLEATDASKSLRDIVIEVEYNGRSDQAKATAIWVEKKQSWSNNSIIPIAGVDALANLNEPSLVKKINQDWISISDIRYGHGDLHRSKWIYKSNNTNDIYTDNNNYDKKYGGRILFEFEVKPNGAASLVNFDVTRQRKSRTYKNFYDSINMTAVDGSIDFPEEKGEDNEKPNDDGGGGDEDNRPSMNLIYSADPPSTVKREHSPIDPLPLDVRTLTAFKLSKNSFREFVRVQVKPVAFPYEDKFQLVRGSRASSKIDWNCTYYTRRASERILEGDNESSSYSIPMKAVPNMQGNGNVSIVDYPDNTQTNTYYLLYDKAADFWTLSDIYANDFAWSGPIDSNGTWTVTFNGITCLIQQGTIGFATNDSFIFNTFKTQSPSVSGQKENNIGLGAIDPTTPN